MNNWAVLLRGCTPAPGGCPYKGGHGETATHGFGYSEAFDPVKPNGTPQNDCNFFQYKKRNKSVKDEALEAKTVSVLNMWNTETDDWRKEKICIWNITWFF